jgi:hypothetical protein
VDFFIQHKRAGARQCERGLVQIFQCPQALFLAE